MLCHRYANSHSWTDKHQLTPSDHLHHTVFKWDMRIGPTSIEEVSRSHNNLTHSMTTLVPRGFSVTRNGWAPGHGPDNLSLWLNFFVGSLKYMASAWRLSLYVMLACFPTRSSSETTLCCPDNFSISSSGGSSISKSSTASSIDISVKSCALPLTVLCKETNYEYIDDIVLHYMNKCKIDLFKYFSSFSFICKLFEGMNEAALFQHKIYSK